MRLGRNIEKIKISTAKAKRHKLLLILIWETFCSIYRKHCLFNTFGECFINIVWNSEGEQHDQNLGTLCESLNNWQRKSCVNEIVFSMGCFEFNTPLCPNHSVTVLPMLQMLQMLNMLKMLSMLPMWAMLTMLTMLSMLTMYQATLLRHVSLASLLDVSHNVKIKCRMLPKAVRELDQNEIVVFASAVKLSQRNSNLI